MAFAGKKRIWLDVPFNEKESAKEAGARWDGAARRWYFVGQDDERVARWLPAGFVRTVPENEATDAAHLSLFSWLSKAETAIRVAYGNSNRVIAEIAEISMSPAGHLYVDMIETDESGDVVAKCRGMMWANRTVQVLKAFEEATGSLPERGMKLLLTVSAKFDAKWGFAAEILDMDASWSLGEMERRRRGIVLALKKEGLFDLNKALSFPRDFFRVGVVAPEGAAGLGDFRKESDVLQDLGLCEFVFSFARFQGEDAPSSVMSALEALMSDGDFDAIAIVRGGGAKSDLAWLDDLALAKMICLSEIPIMTGIGHERDSVVLDEVANRSFDTPSKVALWIMDSIVSGAKRAEDDWNTVSVSSSRMLDMASVAVNGAFDDVVRVGERQLLSAEKDVELSYSGLKGLFFSLLDSAASSSDRAFLEIVSGSPERIMEKGWVSVTDDVGDPVASLSDAVGKESLCLHFRDGNLDVVEKTGKRARK